MPFRRSVVIPAFILLLVLFVSSSVFGAERERIRVLLIGHVVRSYNPVTTFLDPDPSVTYNIVPTSESNAIPLSDEEAKRYIKQYFPRDYEGLARYDFIMFSIPYIVPLTAKQISWLIGSVRNGDCSALTDQGGLRMDIEYAKFWVACGMSDLFANDAEKVLQSGKVIYSNGRYHLQVVRDSPHQVLGPLIPLGIEKIPALGLFYSYPKEGASVLAEADGSFPQFPGAPRRSPWLMYYEYGEGSTWTLCDNFVNPFWCGMYYGEVKGDLQTDVLMNIIWHSAGWSLPEDAFLVHKMRVEFKRYIDKRSMQVSLLEFVDRLGARVAPVENVLARADAAKAEAEDLYLRQDYQASSAQLSEAFELLERAGELALAEKKRTLMWIYVTEWLVVSATLMACGVIAYTLMVRRRFYHEVSTTRIG